mmetsp:Transcript_27759/g.41302  ORF Transcript_27759/g.41302 Transcript_27759/m.41302 type:complete len:106 (-) Transcript_27759:315-632(-)
MAQKTYTMSKKTMRVAICIGSNKKNLPESSPKEGTIRTNLKKNDSWTKSNYFESKKEKSTLFASSFLGRVVCGLHSLGCLAWSSSATHHTKRREKSVGVEANFHA